MGPVSLDWYQSRGLTEKTKIRLFNGEDTEIDMITQRWAAGRIDAYGTEDPYPQEISVPLMSGEDWVRFSEWIRGVRTDEVYTLEQLVEIFEQTNPKISWWREQEPV